MINPTIATLIKNGKENEIVTELDPDKADKYGIPSFLWDLCLNKNSGWLPPLKGNNKYKNADI